MNTKRIMEKSSPALRAKLTGRSEEVQRKIIEAVIKTKRMKLAKEQKRRFTQKASEAIFLPEETNADTLAQILQRMQNKTGQTPISHHRVMVREKLGGQKVYYSTTLSEIARRILGKEYLKAVSSTFKGNPTAAKLAEELIQSIEHHLPEIGITINNKQPLTIVKMLNHLGEEKTSGILQTLADASKVLGQRNREAIQKSNISSDVFTNAIGSIAVRAMHERNQLYDKKSYASELWEFIKKRNHESAKLEQSPCIKKYAALHAQLEKEKTEAMNELTTFLNNNHIQLTEIIK